MNRISQKVLLILMALSCAEKSYAAMVDINMTKEFADVIDRAVDKLGPNLGQAVKDGGDEVRKSVPVVGAEIRKTIQESVPNLDANITKASDAVVKAARAVSSMRAWPIVGIGLAGVVTSIVMLARGIERYIDADDEKQKGKARLRIIASLIGLSASGCVMVNSKPILDFFSE